MKRPKLWQPPAHLTFLASIYGIGMVLFSIPRLILLLQHRAEIADIPLPVILEALWMGWRFDTVISGYFLALPFLILTILAIAKWRNRWAYRLLWGFLVLVYSAGFYICSADIPYFNYFNSRLTIAVLNWTDTPDFMVKMVLQDLSYYPYIGLFLLLSAVFGYISWRLVRRFLYRDAKIAALPLARHRYYLRLAVFTLLAAGLLFTGIRGRLAAKSPIRWGTAFFSNYAFANQLGLNPVFTFMRSWIDAAKPENRRLNFLEPAAALDSVQTLLDIPGQTGFPSPIAREVAPAGPPRPLNVVLVLMENMAAAKMGLFGDSRNLTPHLDSLATTHSYSFRNFYAAGIHTFNGVYSTLFGFPALLNQHPMKTTESMQPFTGLAHALTQRGYQTIFFSTHDEQFDNMGGFLGFNGFQTVVSQKDYPPERVLSTLGVPDHYMFEFSLDYLERFHRTGAPFLAAFLTASDHGPYIIPGGISFTTQSEGIKQQIVEYADWSIGQFLAAARREPWYENTVFVFLADHGTNISPTYDLSLSYHHIPLIIHAPTLIVESRAISGLGGQIDVYPTLMGLLNIPYVNNTLGIDLLREQRRYSYFSADDKLGCLDAEFFWIWRAAGGESLYRYREKERRDYLRDYPQRAARMRTYTQAMLQTAQWLIEKRLVGPQELPEEN